MAKNTYKSNTFRKADKEKRRKSSGGGGFGISFLKDARLKLALGFFLLFAGLYMFFALLSYMFTGQADFSEVGNHQSMGSIFESLRGKDIISNWLGLYGAVLSHFLIFRWFGIASFFIPPLLFLLGFKLVFKKEIVRISIEDHLPDLHERYVRLGPELGGVQDVEVEVVDKDADPDVESNTAALALALALIR